jgi:NitT/TauT family transport system permease protein
LTDPMLENTQIDPGGPLEGPEGRRSGLFRLGRRQSSNGFLASRPALALLGHAARETAWGAVLGALLLGCWQAYVNLTHQPAYFLPAPSAIARSAIVNAHSLFLPATWVTFQEIAGGFLLGSLVGFTLAIGISESRFFARAFNPLIVTSQTIPFIAVAPLFIIWFGFGVMPKVLMAALVTFFPVAINGAAGLSSVDNEILGLMRSLSAKRRDVLFKIRLPASLPYFFTGLKQAGVFSVISAVVAEWVGATEGLGYVMLTANAGFRTAEVFAAILYLSILAIALYGVLAISERLIVGWYYLARADAVGGGTR